MYIYDILHRKINYDHTFEPILPIAKIIITMYNF